MVISCLFMFSACGDKKDKDPETPATPAAPTVESLLVEVVLPLLIKVKLKH